MKRIYYCFVLLVFNVALFGQKFVVEHLPEPINTESDEISPIVMPDGRSLFFTRVGSQEYDHTLMHGGVDLYTTIPYEEYIAILRQAYQDISGSWDGALHKSPANQDIWFAKMDAKATDVYHFKYPLNNALPNSVLSKTPDTDVFYVINQLNSTGDIAKGISYITRLGDSWSFPSPVEIDDFYTITSEISLCVSHDGKFMLMSAKRNDALDLDLYLCESKGTHKWSAPQRLGNVINSEFRETAPSLSDDSKTLYFTSNRDGNNDIYFSSRLDDTWQAWSEPRRMDSPINSQYDDSQPSFNSATGYLYFISKRSGSSDIYRVKLAPAQAHLITIRGRVLNTRTGQPLSHVAVSFGAENQPGNTQYSQNGDYEIQVPRGKKYVIRAEKVGYSDHKEELFFRPDARIFNENYILDLPLTPYGVNDQIVLNPIYFVQSESDIVESSLSEVRRLADILNENPSMHIRIEGHTDNLGRTADLLVLSQQRADRIKNELIRLGIAATRLSTMGYGGTRPVKSNEREEDRKENRRVEIIITKV